MKDKRIWIVIICILVIGTRVTHYTKYYVKSQATAMDTATTAGGMPAGAPSTASASEVKEEEQKEQEATEIPAPMGRSLGAAPAAGAGPGAAYASSSVEDRAEAAAAAEETAASSEDRAQAVQIYSEDEVPVEQMPISPLTGAKENGAKTVLAIDYRQRLMDLDSQIQKMREQETDSNVYSIKTSAETELRMWEGELNSIYNALLELLPQEDAARLASEQQEWLKTRETRAAENTGKSGGSVDRIGYSATMASLTRDRAYELAGRYEQANGLPAQEEEETAAALSGQ